MAISKKPLAAALGAAFLATSVAPLVSGSANPFSAQQLSGGYDLANYDKPVEGKCAEGKCAEGKCSGLKTPTQDAAGKGAEEGKCGEGKCGDKKAAHEGKCGDKKAAEEASGEKKAVDEGASSSPVMQHPDRELQGAGLGLRRALLGPLLSLDQGEVEFMEAAPENWIGVGGRFGKQFRQLAEQYPLVLHGLSLDIGGPDPIDTELVYAVRDFMGEMNVPMYSEHLTYCAAQGHLYDLLPIPFTEEAVHHVARSRAPGAGHYRATGRPRERLLLCPALR